MNEFSPWDEEHEDKSLSSRDRAELRDRLFDQSARIERAEELQSELNRELLSATEIFEQSTNDLITNSVLERFAAANRDALKVLDNLGIILSVARKAHEVHKLLISAELYYHLANNCQLAEELIRVLHELSYTLCELRAASTQATVDPLQGKMLEIIAEIKSKNLKDAEETVSKLRKENISEGKICIRLKEDFGLTHAEAHDFLRPLESHTSCI